MSPYFCGTVNAFIEVYSETYAEFLSDLLRFQHHFTGKLSCAGVCGDDIERRMSQCSDGIEAKVGAHKTSMLQDLERGRPMEIDALVSVVQEMGRLTETPTPKIDIVLALIQQRAWAAGLYD